MITTLLLSTACGSKTTVKCTTNSSGIDVNLNIGFDGNKIEKMDLQYFMDLSSYSDSEISLIKNQEFCSGIKTSMSDFKDAITDCKQNIEDKKLTVNANFDVNKIAASTLEKMQSPEDAKKDLESSGYKCEIQK